MRAASLFVLRTACSCKGNRVGFGVKINKNALVLGAVPTKEEIAAMQREAFIPHHDIDVPDIKVRCACCAARAVLHVLRCACCAACAARSGARWGMPRGRGKSGGNRAACTKARWAGPGPWCGSGLVGGGRAALWPRWAWAVPGSFHNDMRLLSWHGAALPRAAFAHSSSSNVITPRPLCPLRR